MRRKDGKGNGKMIMKVEKGKREEEEEKGERSKSGDNHKESSSCHFQKGDAILFKFENVVLLKNKI